MILQYFSRHDVDVRHRHLDIQVDSRFADGVPKIKEFTFAILSSINDDNPLTAPPQHLVQPEVFEVAAIRQVDRLAGIGGDANHLA